MRSTTLIKLLKEKVLREARYTRKGPRPDGEYEFYPVTDSGVEIGTPTYVEKKYLDPANWEGDWPPAKLRNKILGDWQKAQRANFEEEAQEEVIIDEPDSEEMGPSADLAGGEKKKKKGKKKGPKAKVTGAGRRRLKAAAQKSGMSIVEYIQTMVGLTGKDVDGVYGPDTREAVRTYQRENKLGVDGIVGKNTGKHMAQNPLPGPAEGEKIAALGGKPTAEDALENTEFVEKERQKVAHLDQLRRLQKREKGAAETERRREKMRFIPDEDVDMWDSWDWQRYLAGAGLGAASGAATGAALGTAAFPGVGTALGGVAGGLAGLAGGAWAGSQEHSEEAADRRFNVKSQEKRRGETDEPDYDNPNIPETGRPLYTGPQRARINRARHGVRENQVKQQLKKSILRALKEGKVKKDLKERIQAILQEDR